MRSALLALVSAVVVLPVQAQWLNYKTPGIPRLPDGKPNLAAPAPHLADGKPDLSGLWRGDATANSAVSKAMDAIKPQAWAAALSEKHKLNYGSDNPGTLCLPVGPEVDADFGKIVQTPNLLAMLSGGTNYREVFLDGRELPKDPNPSWNGYSVGHWDGATLVIESNGFNDRTWLDPLGHPHTEALHVTERIRRPDFGHLEIQKTYVDPGALAEPWTVPIRMELDADTEQLEYVCNENERDRGHLIGKTTDEKSVPVALELLSKYAGNYQMKAPGAGQLVDFTFTVSGDHLVMSGAGPTVPVTSLSESEFSAAGATIKFVRNDAGAVTHAMISIVEGDFKAVRK
jgi:hypothetical protein